SWAGMTGRSGSPTSQAGSRPPRVASSSSLPTRPTNCSAWSEVTSKPSGVGCPIIGAEVEHPSFGDPVGLRLESLAHPGGLLAVPTEPDEVISESSRAFWRQAFALNGSVTLRVLPRVFVFGLISAGVCALARL